MYDIILGLIVALLIFGVAAVVAAGENTTKAKAISFFGMSVAFVTNIAILMVMLNIGSNLDSMLLSVTCLSSLIVFSIIFLKMIERLINRFGG